MPDYFDLTEFRTLPDMGSTQKYPDERVEAAAAYIVGIIEREVQTSFIPRTTTETFDGLNSSGIVLASQYVRSITSATVGGVAVAETLDAPYGIVRRRTGDYANPWTAGLGNVAVTYVYGYSATPPDDVKEAAMQGTRAYLLETSADSRVNDRRSSETNDLGGTTTYVLAGKDHPTGYPQVDSVIVAWRDLLRLPGFA